jgi:archaellum component FlaC
MNICNYSGTLKKGGRDEIGKKYYLCVVEEMITIRRSEYEQLLSVIAELRERVRQLQEEIELLKNGRNSKNRFYRPLS